MLIKINLRTHIYQNIRGIAGTMKNMSERSMHLPSSALISVCRSGSGIARTANGFLNISTHLVANAVLAQELIYQTSFLMLFGALNQIVLG